MSAPHERLDQAMNARRLDLRMQWKHIAREARISTAALGAIRRGEYSPSPLTARGIEDALQWERGSIAAILEGGEPTPLVDRHVELRDSARAEDDLADRPPTRQELEEITAEIRRLRKELDDVKAQQAERSTSQVRRDLDMG
jgi:transcriptional regulator with XRE-family HTH domain